MRVRRRLLGKLVLVNFRDHARGSTTLLDCRVVGWLTAIEHTHLVVTPWETDGQADLEEAISISLPDVTELVALFEVEQK